MGSTCTQVRAASSGNGAGNGAGEQYDFDLFTLGAGSGGTRASRMAAQNHGEDLRRFDNIASCRFSSTRRLHYMCVTLGAGIGGGTRASRMAAQKYSVEQEDSPQSVLMAEIMLSSGQRPHPQLPAWRRRTIVKTKIIPTKCFDG